MNRDLIVDLTRKALESPYTGDTVPENFARIIAGACIEILYNNAILGNGPVKAVEEIKKTFGVKYE